MHSRFSYRILQWCWWGGGEVCGALPQCHAQAHVCVQATGGLGTGGGNFRPPLYETLHRSTGSLLIQITFGSDFTQQFNKLEQEYNILKEDLVVVVFKGLGLSLRYPGYQVSVH